MSLREEMEKTANGGWDYHKTDHGQFSRWWRRVICGVWIYQVEDTFIGFMLEKVTSDEELELLWAQWNIEEENHESS